MHNPQSKRNFFHYHRQIFGGSCWRDQMWSGGFNNNNNKKKTPRSHCTHVWSSWSRGRKAPDPVIRTDQDRVPCAVSAALQLQSFITALSPRLHVLEINELLSELLTQLWLCCCLTPGEPVQHQQQQQHLYTSTAPKNAEKRKEKWTWYIFFHLDFFSLLSVTIVVCSISMYLITLVTTRWCLRHPVSWRSESKS